MPDYNLLGSTEVLEELQEGRTRELLLLLQDKPVPEVVDPLNLQSGLSSGYEQSESDYELIDLLNATTDIPDHTGSFSTPQKSGQEINPNENLDRVEATLSQNYSGMTTAYLLDSGQSQLASKSINGLTGGDTFGFDYSLTSGSTYYVVVDADGNSYTAGAESGGSYHYTGTALDVTSGYQAGTNSYIFFTSVTGIRNATNSGYVTDLFAPPTTAPAEFKAWNAIQARDVTTGGSSSSEPVEFEILDSMDTALNSTRIPKERIADEPFTMRNRVYSEDAGSNGQSDYQIATNGDGGHFGIPILTVVSVKKNGSVLDSANWSFDGDTTVTIDTSSVTIASGDTIEIKYDFDVFDSTLQPRAYLSRESHSETSPSISHFRYEYVI